VRGTTAKQLIQMIRKAGAKEVHFRVASPPVISPCYYGMDFPSYEELAANQFESIEQFAQWLGVDSLAYLSTEGLMHAVQTANPSAAGFCNACFTAQYPIPVNTMPEKEAFD